MAVIIGGITKSSSGAISVMQKPTKFVAYLITYRAAFNANKGSVYLAHTNEFDIHHPSESCFMIPPIGWDVE